MGVLKVYFFLVWCFVFPMFGTDSFNPTKKKTCQIGSFQQVGVKISIYSIQGGPPTSYNWSYNPYK